LNGLWSILSGKNSEFSRPKNCCRNTVCNQLTNRFQKYDKNNSGKLNEKEFRHLCRDLGYHLTQQELDLDMKLLDINGDGRIGYQEFIQWWKSDNRFQKLQWGPERLKLIHQLSEKFAKYEKG
jgi:hypothetical protein